MKPVLLNRKLHYWISIAVALPVLVIIVTGLLLQVKKKSAWIQPPEVSGSRGEPAVSFARILEASQGVPEAGVKEWKDIRRIDVRPDKGMLKVSTRNNWEIQIDAVSGTVLQSAYRRSDLIESMHDGSWFHDAVKTWIFLPAGAALLLLWLSGMYLFIPPFIRRFRK
jgi:uncharacterized iron-regulated membrane protein